MYSKRQNKVSRLIQRELGDIFQKGGQVLSRGTLITVTVVRISADLSVARVYLSLFPAENSKELLNVIKENTKVIRHELASRIRNQVKKIPDLSFFLDDSLEYSENISNLLK